MEWWQAYLLWRLDTIVAFLVLGTVVFGLGCIVTLIIRFMGLANCYSYENNKPEKN